MSESKHDESGGVHDDRAVERVSAPIDGTNAHDARIESPSVPAPHAMPAAGVMHVSPDGSAMGAAAATPIVAVASAVAVAAEAPMEIGEDMLLPYEPPKVETRIDFERGMSYAPLVPLCLIAANTAAFVWMVGAGKLADLPSLVSAGAIERDAIAGGQLWRLATYMFLHGGVEHLLSNSFMVYVLGMGCERAFGLGRLVLLYVLAGIAGGILSACLTASVSVGASGAIFGLAGALIMTLHRNRHTFFVRDKRIGVVILIWALYTIAVGFLSPQVDNWCHIGGFLAGAGIGWFLPMKKRAADAGFFVRPGAASSTPPALPPRSSAQ